MHATKLFPSLIFLTFVACNTENQKYIWKSKEVTASAYNSTRAQTDGEPRIAAWGDKLVPGMKTIAVSRDLIRLGLVRDTQVKIDGLDGTYLVKDKMHYRWRNTIDLYMGTDVKKAKEWGRKKVKIHFRVKRDTNSIKKQ